MRSTIALAVAAASVLVGCAQGTYRTEPTRIDAKKVPKDRLLAFQDSGPGTAHVVVVRDQGALGSGCYYGVKIGGQVAAFFDEGETADFFVPSGETDMEVVDGPIKTQPCGVKTGLVERQSNKAGVDNRYRMSFGMYRRARLLPLSD